MPINLEITLQNNIFNILINQNKKYKNKNKDKDMIYSKIAI